MSEEKIPDLTVAEICNHVQREFARFGIPGQVQISGEMIELINPQGKVSHPIGPWWRSWAEMDEASKGSNAAHLARQLKQIRNASRAPSQMAPAPRDHSTLHFVLVVGMIAVAVAWFAGFDPRSLMDRAIAGEQPEDEVLTRRDRRVGGELGGAQPLKNAPPEDSSARAARTCAATHARLLKGGSVGIADVDGWVVEIFLAKSGEESSLVEHQEMKEFVREPKNAQGSKLIWPAVAGLVKVDTSDTLAKLRGEVWETGSSAISTLRFSLHGSLVDPFFEENTRGLVNGLAQSLSRAVQATHAAVYARCEDSNAHAMGSWFWGKGVPEVATAFLYSMGMFAEPPQIASPFFRSPGKKETDYLMAFENIRANAAVLDRPALGSVVKKLAGQVVPQGKNGVMLTFPFRDGGRAVRASKLLAGVTNLGKK